MSAGGDGQGGRGGWGRRLVIRAVRLAYDRVLPRAVPDRVKISLSQTAIARAYIPVFDFSQGLEGLRQFVGGLSADNYRFIGTDWLYLRLVLRASKWPRYRRAAARDGHPQGLASASALAPPPAADPVHAGRAAVLDLVPHPHVRWFIFPARRPVEFRHSGGLAWSIRRPCRWPPTPRSTSASSTRPAVHGAAHYASLEKIDETLLEAAADLGCPRWKAFWLVTLPLALPGVAAGALLLVPIVGDSSSRTCSAAPTA